jgi:hypothetical protein
LGCRIQLDAAVHRRGIYRDRERSAGLGGALKKSAAGEQVEVETTPSPYKAALVLLAFSIHLALRIDLSSPGRVAEWFKAAVLKTIFNHSALFRDMLNKAILSAFLQAEFRFA